MNNISKMFIFVLVLTFLIPRPVSAGDYVTDAIEALKTSNVYVAPGTEGTDYDTSSQLKKILITNDNIVLVILPSEALVDTDLYIIAQKISEGLDNQKTIGLAVGRQVIGYSVILPEGVAADKMERANSVSNNPVTVLINFTQNIHKWQVSHPLPTPTPVPTAIPTPKPTPTPIELPKTNEVPPIIWALVIGVFFTITVVSAVQLKKGRDRSKYNSIISKINKNF